MSVLVDTNLLTRSMQPASPQFQAATESLRALGHAGERLCVPPQVLYEFWAVATRPAGENGLGRTTAEANAECLRVLSMFTLLVDSPATFVEWHRLVLAYDVKGKSSHDARLVAAMNVHDVKTILTFNVADFRRYPGIAILEPESFVSTAP